MELNIETLEKARKFLADNKAGRYGIRKFFDCSESEARFIRDFFTHEDVIRDFIQGPTQNTLIIGDLHAPFIRRGYLEFCQHIRDVYRCDKIIFIGDLVDNHFTSFHDIDPDGHSAGTELDKAIEQIDGFYRAFPDAFVILGNHDRIPDRKAFNAGISSRWIKPIGEILETPKWKYVEQHVHDNVLYTHGEGQQANARMLSNMQSVVQGHWHSRSYVTYSVGVGHRFFAMQVGCGIDRKAYAFKYAKDHAKPHINVGVIANGVPRLEYMELGGKH